MIRLDAMRERISDRVEELPASRLLTAADFAKVVDSNQLPQVTPAAFVMFGGLTGGVADVITGLFRQAFREVASVVLMDRVAGNPLQDKALAELSPTVRKIIACICGWTPGAGTEEEALGAFELLQAELIGATGGALVFQIDFALNDQLRIPT